MWKTQAWFVVLVTVMVTMGMSGCQSLETDVAPMQPGMVGLLSIRLVDGGEVGLSMAELSRLPRSRVVDGGVAYEGVALRDVLARAGVRLGAELRGARLREYVVVEGADGYGATFAAAELSGEFTDRVVLLADRAGGARLSGRDGQLKVVVPGEKKRGRWVRGVVRIVVGRGDDAKAERPVFASVEDFERQVCALPGDFEHLSAAQWNEYVRVAGEVQRLPADTAEDYLAQFDSRKVCREDFSGDSKLFVVLRVVFDLPERYPVGLYECFLQSLDWEKAKIDSETIDYAWPVVWSGPRPVVRRFYPEEDGKTVHIIMGRLYYPADEYLYLHSRFGFRTFGHIPL